MSYKALILKIYKKLLQFISKTPSNSLKMEKGHEYTISTDINSQQVHEKVDNITNHQGNAEKNHKEISPHNC